MDGPFSLLSIWVQTVDSRKKKTGFGEELETTFKVMTIIGREGGHLGAFIDIHW